VRAAGTLSSSISQRRLANGRPRQLAAVSGQPVEELPIFSVDTTTPSVSDAYVVTSYVGYSIPPKLPPILSSLHAPSIHLPDAILSFDPPVPSMQCCIYRFSIFVAIHLWGTASVWLLWPAGLATYIAGWALFVCVTVMVSPSFAFALRFALDFALIYVADSLRGKLVRSYAALVPVCTICMCTFRVCHDSGWVLGVVVWHSSRHGLQHTNRQHKVHEGDVVMLHRRVESCFIEGLHRRRCLVCCVFVSFFNNI